MEDERLRELWQAVIVSWDDDAAHGAFIEHCRETRQLGAAAARYREERGHGNTYREDGERTEKARKRLAAITAMALDELRATRAAPAPEVGFGRTLGRWAMALLFVAAVSVVILSLISK